MHLATNEVVPTPIFLKKVKRLRKKFHTLHLSLLALEAELLINPKLGKSYGHHIYKIRLSDQSKGKGKSGGFRIITYLIEESNEGITVYLITILDKSEESTLNREAILKLIHLSGL